MHAEKLGPVESAMAPLLLSIGRAVLGAAALEKVLLVEIARRHAAREGFTPELDQVLSRLERRPAGALLRELKQLDVDDDLAAQIAAVIGRRNQLVHGFMEDSDVIAAIESGETASVVERVDRLAIDCQLLINRMAPTAFGDLVSLMDVPIEQVFDVLLSLDVDAISDERFRAQIAMLRAADADELRAALRGHT